MRRLLLVVLALLVVSAASSPAQDVGLGVAPTNTTLLAPGPIGSTTPSTGAFTTLTASGSATAGNGTASTFLVSNGGATTNSGLTLQQGGVTRSIVRLNNGATLKVDAYDSSGVIIDTPINIVNASGGTVTIARPLALTGATFGAFSSTPAAQPANTVDPETVLSALGLQATGGAHSSRRRFIATTVNLNSLNTDVATISPLPAKYRPSGCILYDASTSLTTAQFAIRDAAAGAGNVVVATGSLAAATTAAVVTNAGSVTTGQYFTASTLYIRCTTAQGSAATASIHFEFEELQ